MYNPNIIHWLCQYIYVFYAKNFFCMNRQYLFRGFWSREAFFDKTTEMFADLRSGCGRAASLAPTAGTQCLPRLRRTHGVPLSPTAGTQCLSRLWRSLQKQNARRLLSAPQGKHKRAQPWENSRGWAFLVYREDAFPSILSCWT